MLKPFSDFLNEEVNTHMLHLEQLIFAGVNNTRNAINTLRSLRDMLAGKGAQSIDMTLKVDGSPALFVGHDPKDNQFFVAKKSLFNKDPKVYKSIQDIDADTSGDLNVKLRIAFDVLKGMSFGPYQIVQGDIMFTKKDLATETIDGESYTTFHPNTIVYAVKKGTPIEQEISKAEIGIVFHTSYTGNDLNNLSADYHVDTSKFSKNDKAWIQAALIPNLTQKVLMNDKETAEITALLSQAGKIFNKISSSTMKELESNPMLVQQIETFNNTKVRAMVNINDAVKHVDELIKYMHTKWDNEIAKMKSEKGRINKSAKKEEMMAFFSDSNKKNLIELFKMGNILVKAKLMILNKLSEIGDLSTFVKTKNGFRVTGQEGFVAINSATSKAVKLVDRLEFSHNNFSSDIIKSWH